MDHRQPNGTYLYIRQRTEKNADTRRSRSRNLNQGSQNTSGWKQPASHRAVTAIYWPLSNSLTTVVKGIDFKHKTWAIILPTGLATLRKSVATRLSAYSGCGWRNGFHYGRLLRIYWISNQGQPTRGGPTDKVMGEVLTTPHLKNWPCYVTYAWVLGLDWSFGTT